MRFPKNSLIEALFYAQKHYLGTRNVLACGVAQHANKLLQSGENMLKTIKKTRPRFSVKSLGVRIHYQNQCVGRRVA
jgi:hypothetical protein